MAKPRMDLTSFVGKLLEQDDVDALREGVQILAQAVMETEVSSQIGALSHPHVGHARRHDRAQDPQGHPRHLLSFAARTTAARREGAPRRRGRGLR